MALRRPRRDEDPAMFARAAAKSHDVVQNRKWRATADEDGHHSFAVAL
jgi:hypothetical protein